MPKYPILLFSSHTEPGSYIAHKMLKTKYNCVIIETPTYNPKTDMWEIKYQHPDLYKIIPNDIGPEGIKTKKATKKA